MFKQEYYDAIRCYIPEDAKRVLDEQVPVIRQNIAAEIDAFATNLGKKITEELEKAAREQTKELKEDLESLRGQIQTLSAHADPAVRNSVQALNSALDAYEARFKTLGTVARSTINGVAKVYGIPLSFL